VTVRSLVALVSVLVLAACGGGESAEPTSRASTAESVAASASAGASGGGMVSVFDLQTGDCFDASAEETVEEVEQIDCADPHTYEVYAAVEHPAGANEPYPGDEDMTAFAEEQCRTEFQDFVGIDYDSSELFIFFLHPSAETWQVGDREVLCTVYLENEQLEGSVKGSER
jgi:hypothetical protein